MSDLLLITNADDLGLSEEVNGEVERLHRNGALSSATIMANGGAVESVKGIQDRNPKLGLGVHLNATNFKALTTQMQRSVLCDDDGVFASNFRTHNHLGLTRILTHEWMAQIERLTGMGISLDHLDSHHHVHTWPSALPALKNVSKAAGIPWVRNTRNCVPSAERAGFKSKVKYAGKGLWTSASRWVGMKLSGGFCSVLDYRQLKSEGRFDLASVKTLELMCHPGDFGNKEYVEESEWLSTDFMNSLEKGWRLGNYRDLT